MKIPLVLYLAGALALELATAADATPFYEEVFANIGEGDVGDIVNGRLVQAADGNFYGTTRESGVLLGGNVFRLTPAGKLTAFHPFNLQPSEDGSEPRASLALGPDGSLYGSTTQNSGNGVGAIFRLSLGGALQELADINSGGPNSVSYTQFTLGKDGAFYAAVYDTPTIPPSPPLSPTSRVERFNTDGVIVFSTALDPATTGVEPLAPLTEGADHNFYGTASEGGAGAAGTIFRVTPAGAVSLFHTFHGTDGTKPASSLVLALDGNFYGTTTHGGAHDKGTIFRVTPAGVLTTLVSFAGANGTFPAGGLTIGSDGNLYGTTNLGGSDDKGTFYRFTLNGDLTTLASFSASTGSVPANGVTLGFDGNFYGTTFFDGDHQVGTAYRVTPAGVITKLASFGDAEGHDPQRGIIEGSDGNFYGVDGLGGGNNYGTIFQITPSGQATTLATFGEEESDLAPIAQGADGSLFGVTYFGGANGGGIAYRVGLNGTFTKLADLDNTTGMNAVDFLRGQDGNFYCLTERGGANSHGTIFRLTSGGAITPFASLTGGEDRFNQDADGNFYGTAGATSDYSDGIAFKVDSAGTESIIGIFDSGQNGEAPTSGLTRGLDGNFYGALARGGPQFEGMLYRLTPGGVITLLSPASYATTHLLRMPDGSFFGTTYDPDADNGTIFRATTTGVVESWPVFDGIHGNRAEGFLTSASDGYVYGIASAGGTVSGGVVYRFTSLSPTLTSLSPTSGHPRESIVLTGHYLAGTTSVSFNGVAATSFTIDSSTRITAVIPSGAKAGPITITNPLGTGTTGASFMPFPPVPQFQNISTRGQTLTGDNVLIAGFIITGTGQKEVLVRGIGPSLTNLHVPGALQDPVLELHDEHGALIALNDNWADTQEVAIEPTNIAPTDARESAIFRPLDPGAYTVILKGKNNTTGVGLIEVYDLSRTPGVELANISARGLVDAGDNVIIAGFIVGETGSGPAREVLRAIGPSLSNAQVAGALQDPSLELHDSNGALVATNDNWATDPHSAQIQAADLAPSDPRESAMLPTLAPGAYTVIVRGVNGTTGVALVEAYNLH